jgi:hypothetical protein
LDVIASSKNKSINLADIGAGSALFSKELIKRKLVDSVIAVDTGYHKEYFDEENQICYTRKGRYENSNYFLLTDVLEHIKDDYTFLSAIVNESPKGSTFVITVPAMQSLWSGHDVFLKHFRRYTRSELVDLVEKSGLEVKSARYTYTTVFPLAYLHRKFAGKKNSSQLKETSWVLGKILTLLLVPDRFVPWLPFGVSLFLVGERKL